jgi:quinol-cytochrome oxidoreductase complex cytochrome b subunit/mono/diheme cytochrome c family protein
MKALFNWFDDRTGFRELIHEALYENIPGGSRWRYVSGSMLAFAFVTQLITGVFLWMYYSPSNTTAWESVYYIQNHVTGGWLLRGIHHYMAQAMVVLLPLHMIQVIIDKAYVKPREVNFWLGLILMLLVMALGLTGYLLPWDQKGYWATKVATNLMSLAPGGAAGQKIVVGDTNYGNLTLTKFFALHAGVLPALTIFFLALHIAMFRKHGITAYKAEKGKDEYFWPRQVFKDSIAIFAMMAIVVILVLWRGTELTAPADAVEEYSAARPEWYFLFLFQLLKKFKSEFIGAIVVPGVIVLFMFAMPLLGKWKWGHAFNVAFICVLILGAAFLTGEALYHDNYSLIHQDPRLTLAKNGAKTETTTEEAAASESKNAPDEAVKIAGEGSDAPAEETEEKPVVADAAGNALKRWQDSKIYLDAVTRGHDEYERAKEYVEFFGIGPEGAAARLKDDPEIQGKRIFVRQCASCHSWTDDKGHGVLAQDVSAPNLYGFATEAWFEKLLDPEQIVGADMFGKTKHAGGDMVTFVQSDYKALPEDTKKAIVRAMVAEAGLVSHRERDKADQELIAKGREAINTNCATCHKVSGGDDPGAGAPDLTDYGSETWLKEFIGNPAHERFYGDKNDRMPAFAPGMTEEEASKNLLSANDLELLALWLRREHEDLYVLFNKKRPQEKTKAPEAAKEEPADDAKKTNAAKE